MTTMALPLTSELETIQPRVLIADDQPDVLEALRLLLKGHGYATEAVTSPVALLEAVSGREFDLVLMDLNYARDTTSGREGLDLLARLQAVEGAPPIVVMTGWATVGLAVEAMQRGVGDFVEKPWVNSRLLEILKHQIDLGRERREERRRQMEKAREQDEIAVQLHQQEREVEEALRIQKGFLPHQIPQIPGYAIAAAWQPARTVGGDYYDVLDFGGDSVGICIADVAGKGMPAAMLMSNLQAAVRGLASASMSPERLCDRLNALVCRNIANDRFITLFYAHLDGPSRRLRYADAGHNVPMIVHRDGSHERPAEGGGVLGVFELQTYTMGVQDLEPGDRAVFFTDGVTEACGPDEKEFGEARLLQLVQQNRTAGAGELQRIILKEVGDYCGGNWNDDATLIVVEVE
ncbi:MAG TPA: SpoIIE family protein phosphatase [Candidatus Acidoferrum sp.]|nr:SpoIIE family protein phosphatase [Candidatus Acidoferrum sp.]